MQEPVHAGCMAEVIGGILGKDSPNLGLIVKVITYVGDTERFGRIWRCEAEYGERNLAHSNRPNVPDGQVDFAQDWLKKIPDPPVPAAVKDRELTLET